MEHLVNEWRRSKYWFCDHDLCLIRSYSIVTDTFAPGPLFLTYDEFVRIFRWWWWWDLLLDKFTHIYITPSMNQMANNSNNKRRRKKNCQSDNECAHWTMKNWRRRARGRRDMERELTSFANRRIKIPIVYNLYIFIYILAKEQKQSRVECGTSAQYYVLI